MTKPNMITAKFLGAVRCKRLSTNGNPSYDVITDAGTFRTETDESIGYSLPNYTNTRLDSCLIGKTVQLSLTKRERVTDIRPL